MGMTTLWPPRGGEGDEVLRIWDLAVAGTMA